MSTTLNITGNAVNSDGVATPFTGTIVVSAAPPVIQSVGVTPPNPQPAGTLRTITINATGAVSYTCLVNGVAATATAQPNVFTFQT